MGPVTPGIDVSSLQGNIDWAAVAGAGEDFAIARADDGTTADTKFQQNWAGIAAAGMIRGAYQFFEPNQDAATEANQFLATVGAFGSGDLPLILDVEVTGGKSAAFLDAAIGVWVARVTAATGRAPLIYTSAAIWNSSLNDPRDITADLWIANWGVVAPNVPDPPWTEWQLWQYSDSGVVPGIATDVDLDKFNGSVSDLQSCTATPEPSSLGLLLTALIALASGPRVVRPLRLRFPGMASRCACRAKRLSTGRTRRCP